MTASRTARRAFLRAAGAGITVSAAGIVLAACGSSADASTNAPATNTASAVRIGYQKGGSLPVLKAQQRLEKDFSNVSWVEFPAGPPLLEALNTGSIDLGATGESPAIFAQAAGSPLVYVASALNDVRGQALILPNNSPIASVAELKGKKVAFGKGTSAHYFVIQALKDAGLAYTDIEPAFLNPPDARPAFEGGSVDAWAIWEPYLTVTLKAGNARVLRDGTGLPPRRSFYLASRTFAEQHTDQLHTVLEEIQNVEQWSKEHPDELAKVLAPVVGIDAAILQDIATRSRFGIEPINDQIVADQQNVADTYTELGLIPKKIVIKDAIWTWKQQ